MRVLLTLLLIFMVACSESDKTNEKNIVGQQFLDQEMMFSTPYPMFIAILQLKQPALLEDLLDVDGKKVINKELLAKIDQEQKNLVQELKSISPEIRVLYTYKRVMNGLTIVAPMKFSNQISRLSSISSFEADQQFASPQTTGEKKVVNLTEKISEINSVNYISADKVHQTITVKSPDDKTVEVPVMGQGIKVGIIDTGIDYTHKMLGGSGNPDDYESVDPLTENSQFPNRKVVGGKDFVGKEFSTFTVYFDKYIPTPDVNPIDVGGHGTHVAGTVAGIGDNVNTYSGVAPKADLYALKVFGDEDGGTSDSVVLAAFEYAVDPNEDFELSDSLDVLNLSLGSGYGTPHEYYSYAISNLTDFGMLVVASAGNSGDVDYITGSPGSSDDALSVAAGIDDMLHNWNFESVVFNSSELQGLKVKALEATFTVKISEVINEGVNINSKMVYIGEAKEDLDQNLKDRLKGKIALIDRGTVAFTDKFKRAQNAGAIAVVMVNNTESDPIAMGGDDEEYEFKIPGIMITKSLGDQIKKDLENVMVDFTSGELLEEPELIGTITSFSSKGPRSLDSVLKPEITAPGQQIISASVATGTEGVRLNGTSMSAPHIAGVMALMRQKHQDLTAQDIKSMVMSSAEEMSFDLEGESKVYPLSRQGAGMVNVLKAIESQVVTYPQALSLGEHSIIQSKNLSKKIVLKNLTNELKTVSLAYVGDGEVSVTFSEATLELKSKESKEVDVSVTLEINKDSKQELNGYVLVKSAGSTLAKVPVLAITNKASKIGLESRNYEKDVINNQQELNLLLSNTSPFDGAVMPYNLLALDERKPKRNEVKSSICDIQAVGYKYYSKEVEEAELVNGKRVPKKKNINVLRFAVKTYNPLTDWHQCLTTVEFDIDLDGNSDYMLMSGRLDRMPLESPATSYESILLDSEERQRLVSQNRLDNLSNESANGFPLNLTEAIVSRLEAKPFDHSTVYELEVDARLVGKRNLTAIRVSMSNVYGSDVQETDSLIGGTDGWSYLNIRAKSEPYANLPMSVQVERSSQKFLSLLSSGAEVKNPLMLLMPQNKFNFSDTVNDSQMLVITP